MLILISMRIAIMESRRESNLLELGKKRRVKNSNLCIYIYGDLPIIKLHLLMMQPGKPRLDRKSVV